MNRLTTAITLSLSVVAVLLAGVSLLRSRAFVPSVERGVGPDVDRLTELVAGLERDLAELSSKYEALERRAVRGRAGFQSSDEDASTDPAEPPEAATLEETVAALGERLESLESAEKIHLLAQSGRKKVAEKRLVSALSDLRNPEILPEERIDAMGTLWGLRKRNRAEVDAWLKEEELGEADLAWPMIEIARDAGVDAELRGEALRSLAGMQTKEIRQPLMEIFASDDALAVRTGAFDALAWHMKDRTVRQVLRGAASESQPAEIRSRATRLAPKLDYFDRQDAERAARGGDGAAETDAEK